MIREEIFQSDVFAGGVGRPDGELCQQGTARST